MCSNKAECNQFLPERVDVFELKDATRQNLQVESVLRGHACTFPANINKYQKKPVHSRRNSLISSAKERRVRVEDEILDPGEINEDAMQLQAQRILIVKTEQTKNAPVIEIKQNDNSPEIETKQNDNSLLKESQQTVNTPKTENEEQNEDSTNKEIKQKDNSTMKESKQTVNTLKTGTTEQNEDSPTCMTENKLNEESSVMETKNNESSPACKQGNKKNTKKSGHSKAKKTAKKRRNSMKKSPGVTGIFARLVGSHGHKKHQGQPLNSKQQTEPRTNLLQSKDNSSKYLSIQKLQATYASKKTDNKGNAAVLLPRVSNTSLTKDNSTCIRSTSSSPRKQQQEVENVSFISPRPSPRKLLNSDDDKVKKIYLSDAHSGMITGIPCAPPCTPTVDELKKVEYIPSLTDVKSQRAIKSRLVTLGNKVRAEEQRKKEKASKEEQKRAYGAILQLKQRQRAEIYALNKVMTELENDNFKKFMEEHSAETLPVFIFNNRTKYCG
ncbi:hypothetical protein ACROYT_G023450 [Oculina patagonica]